MMATSTLIGIIIATLWGLIAILFKQAEKKGATLEELSQRDETIDVLKNQADIAARPNISRSDLYARLLRPSDK